MSQQTKFIIAAIAFLLPVGVLIAQQVFLILGRFVYNFVFPKLKRSSKLRYKLIEFNNKNGGPELTYTLIGCGVLYLVFAIISLFV